MRRTSMSLVTALFLGILVCPAFAQDPGGETGKQPRTFDAEISPEGPRAGYGEVVVLGPGARLRFAVQGESKGVGFVPTLDGERVSFEAWSSSWEPGAHRISGNVLTTEGEEIPVTPLEIVFDPTAPRIDRQVGGMELLERYGLDQGVEPETPKRGERHRGVDVYWSADGRRWLPLLPPDREKFDWVVAGDEPQVFLWIAEHRALRLEDGTPIAKGRVIRLWASDELSAVRTLLLSATPERLELQARDLVGNTTRTTWNLPR